TLLRRLGAGDPTVVRLLDLARRNVDRAAALTQRILAFARKQPLDPRPLAPAKLVAGMTELLRQALGDGVLVETVLADDLWPISADQNQLETAILNLAVNARDAMPAGGRFTLEIADVVLDDAYTATNAEVQPGQYVMIALSDTGTGMPRETLEKAFEPFFTTKEPGRGTGLGLSQVYGFIKQSGGHLAIYSEPGAGTTVKLYLPRLADADVAEQMKEARPPAPSMAGETILVVEDDADVRAFTVDALQELRYHVLEASDAQSALATLDAEPAVDLLFTDMGLPGGVNGRALADAARQRRPGLLVLFTTAYAQNAIVHHGRLDPGVALIGKPFTHADLATKIRRVLDARDEGAARGADPR